jgi:hypothetical protein
MLKADPGNYELVRRVLGHRNIATTRNFYIGLETLEATRAGLRLRQISAMRYVHGRNIIASSRLTGSWRLGLSRSNAAKQAVISQSLPARGSCVAA